MRRKRPCPVTTPFRGIAPLAFSFLVGVTAGSDGALRITEPLSEQESLREFRLTPDGRTVVYEIRDRATETSRILSRSVDGGGTPAQLNRDEPVPSPFSRPFELSSDGEWAVMVLPDPAENSRFGIYSRRMDGSGPLNDLTPTQVLISAFSEASGYFQIAPDSTHVVIRADSAAGVEQLFGRAIDGSGTTFDIALPPPGRDNIESFAITSDSQHVIYQSFAAYRASIDGSHFGTKLSGDFRAYNIQVSADSTHIAYESQPDVFAPWTFYGSPIDASQPPVALGGPTRIGSINQRGTFKIAPDGDRVAFMSDQTSEDVFELFSRSIDGTDDPVRLNGPLVRGGDVTSFEISPDSQWVVYTADQSADNLEELFARPIDGSGPPIKLDVPLGEDESVHFRISSDSRHVLSQVTRSVETNGDPFQAHTLFFRQLYSVPIDGSDSAVRLSSNVGETESTADFQVAPDGQFVVFGKDPDGGSIGINNFNFPQSHELFVVPIEGGEPRLVTDPVSGVGSFEWTSDSSTLVFRAGSALYSAVNPRPQDPVGDYNGDSLVDQADLDLVLASWGADAASAHRLWRTNLPSGVVDQAELDAVLGNWHRSELLASHTAVPEPSTLLILAIASFALIGVAVARRELIV